MFQKAKDDFLSLEPEIQELSGKMKELRKQQKENTDLTKQHMEATDCNQLDVGGYLFERQEIERCPFNEKNFEEIIEDPNILTTYRETFTETRSSFKVKQVKKRRRKE